TARTKTAISSSQRHRRVAVENPAGTRDSLPQTARIREHRIPGSGDPNNDIKVLIYVGAIRSGSHPVHDFMNAATHSFQIRRAPWTGAGSLAGDERKRTLGVLQLTNAPWQGRGELLQPLPGCVSLFL